MTMAVLAVTLAFTATILKSVTVHLIFNYVIIKDIHNVKIDNNSKQTFENKEKHLQITI